MGRTASRIGYGKVHGCLDVAGKGTFYRSTARRTGRLGVHFTPRGRKVLEAQDFEAYRKGHLLPSEGLDPILVRKVKQAFIRGNYDTAVFQAFKEVEVRVRKKTGLSNSDIGVPLMRKAFNPTAGVLVDKSMDSGERTARMELFAGAIGTYKNPSSHRDVELSDPKEAADIIHIANQLLRIVDSITSP